MRGLILPGAMQPGDRLPDHNFRCDGPAVLAVGEPFEDPELGRVIPVTFAGELEPRLFPSGADILVDRPDPEDAA